VPLYSGTELYQSSRLAIRGNDFSTAVERHGIVPRRPCALDSKGQERKAFLINIIYAAFNGSAGTVKAVFDAIENMKKSIDIMTIYDIMHRYLRCKAE
jgi:hypothetical protein